MLACACLQQILFHKLHPLTWSAGNAGQPAAPTSPSPSSSGSSSSKGFFSFLGFGKGKQGSDVSSSTAAGSSGSSSSSASAGVKVVGLIQPSEKPSAVLPDNVPQALEFHWVDVPTLVSCWYLTTLCGRMGGQAHHTRAVVLVLRPNTHLLTGAPFLTRRR